MDIQTWEQQWKTILDEFQAQVSLSSRDLLVIGCSTSEVVGKKIGTSGTFEVAAMLFRQLEQLRKKTGVALAFQCCEHLNRALVIEREVAEKRNLDEVTVIPVREAGGAMAAYAYEHLTDPVVVEEVKGEAGIDIGSTLIGMHLKQVVVPVRVSNNWVGNAYVTLAKSRPKLIGGERAVYRKSKENET